jgi:FixJ family two-component response regulator
MLAEDDDDVRATLAVLLELFGFDVQSLATGTELLNETRVMVERGQPPAILVTDLRMPGMTGLDAIEALTADGWRLPAIVMTAFGDLETQARADELNVELLHKPFGADDLLTLANVVVTREQPRRICCAACGDPEGLAPLGAAYFCRSCREIAKSSDPDDDQVDLGGGD